jgi:phage/plasmid-associated DNA primase
MTPPQAHRAIIRTRGITLPEEGLNTTSLTTSNQAGRNRQGGITVSPLGEEQAYKVLEEWLNKKGLELNELHSRNNNATKLAGYARGCGNIRCEDVISYLAKESTLEQHEIETLVNSAWKYPEGNNYKLSPEEIVMALKPFDTEKPVSNAYELVDSINTEDFDLGSTKNWHTTEWQQALKLSFVKAATDASCPLKVNDLGEIYLYDRQQGMYRPVEHIEGVMERLADRIGVPYKVRGEKFNTSVSRMVCERIESSPEGFLSTTQKDAINCSNGVVVFGEDGNIKFTSHSPDYNFTYSLTTQYEPEAEAPQFTKTLLKGCLPDQMDRDTFMEHVGVSLASNMPTEKIVYLVGDGMNGKSTLRRVIVGVLGGENVASVSLPELLGNTNTRRELLDKPLNFPDESRGYASKDTEEVKKLASEAPMLVKTLYKDTVHVPIPCKHIFPLNELPQAGDNTFGGDRRALIIRFPNRFDGDKAKADTTLAGRIIDKEASGVLNLIIEGRQRYLRNLKEGRPHGYSRTEIIDRAIAEGKIDSIPEYAFLSNPVGKYETLESNGHRRGEPYHTYLVVGRWYTSGDIFKAWCDYCKYNNMGTVTAKEQRGFVDRVNTYFKDVLHEAPDKDGRVTHNHRFGKNNPQRAYLFRLPASIKEEQAQVEGILSEL